MSQDTIKEQYTRFLRADNSSRTLLKTKTTRTFDTYAEAEAFATSKRSYVGRTLDSKGNFSGFYVPC